MSFKILSLDGGGSWAILQAMALMDIYPGRTTKEILNEFDLVTANSGGSLVLACMIEFDDMQQVMGMFLSEEMRKSVFSDLRDGEKTLIEWIAGVAGLGPKYKTSRKIGGIEKALPKFGKELLAGIAEKAGVNSQFLITTYDYDNQRAVYMRSDPKGSSGKTYEVTLAQAVHAASNAPVNYFDEPARFNYQDLSRRFWDGAVGGNNNPSLVGVVEAMGVYRAAASDIRILSIGTGNVLLPIEGLTFYGSDKDFLVQKKTKASLGNDVMKMANCILQEPTDAATYMSHIILGGEAGDGAEPRIVRLNPLLQPYLKDDKWVLPDGFKEDKFRMLIELDMDAVKQDEVTLITYLGAMWIADKAKNQPVRADGKTYRCEIGYPLFSQGKAAWLNQGPFFVKKENKSAKPPTMNEDMEMDGGDFM